MTDRYAVVWARTAAEPRKMGSLVATGREMRFSYAPEFLEQGQDISGLSLMLPPRLWRERPFVHQSTEILPLLPRLMALIPGRNANNIQRRLYTSLLAKRSNPPVQGFETEWELLMLTGHNGIGHVDVFPDDRAALETYAGTDTPRKRVGSRSEFWKFLKEGTSPDFSDEAIDIMRLIGPTPSVGGQIPKLLVAIPDRDSWDGSLAEPGTQKIDGIAYVDVVMRSRTRNTAAWRHWRHCASICTANSVSRPRATGEPASTACRYWPWSVSTARPPAGRRPWRAFFRYTLPVSSRCAP
jgi:serine/threonine-protein kinase HipA